MTAYPSPVTKNNNTKMAVAVYKRPVLYIQHDWNDSLMLKDGEAWITCREHGKPGKHGKISNVGISEDGHPIVVGSDGFCVDSITKKTVNVIHREPDCNCLFVAPVTSFSKIHQKSIVCLDVTSGGLGVSASVDNKLYIWDTSNGEVRRTLHGHVWDVYRCRYFPSGIVVLSGGADMQLKIWSAETGSCAATLVGHKSAINDTAIVDRGQNIVSVSKDGTARLWDCGQCACLAEVAKVDTEINSCDLTAIDIDLGHPEVPPSEREVGTSNKLLIVGCENGSLHGVGLFSRKLVFSVDFSSAVNCCKFISTTQIVCGTQSGHIYILDVSNPREIIASWEESASSVLCILPYKQGFFVGRGDGTCTFYSLKSESIVQLTGPDCEPVYSIAADNIFLYTACRDATIRKYKLPLVLT